MAAMAVSLRDVVLHAGPDASYVVVSILSRPARTEKCVVRVLFSATVCTRYARAFAALTVCSSQRSPLVVIVIGWGAHVCVNIEVSHGGCPDGAAAAIIMKRALQAVLGLSSPEVTHCNLSRWRGVKLSNASASC
eukprot:422402-Amphidinium_carterae.1